MTEADPAAAIDELQRSMRAPERRVAGILYWYALSGALARLALIDGRDADRARVTVGPGGWPQVDGAPPTPDPLPALGRHFRSTIPVVAAASGAPTRALWAIGTDSVASASLAAPDPAALAAAVLAECGPEAPPARFEAAPGRGTVVRRGSCCLLYLCPGNEKCLSCPRQTPEERHGRLAVADDR
ncbi:(2Fe-2S)-binding protein [Tsukamurella strandjordii]|uniref:(2Fe-2S)-binding protein n=1 Tax=Tsukamurella strandjordii TaxID=147577 RepID=A0AA90NFW2_9ACTN|nr:(2Fe-2S)-binding protein [Tsukamurella strandjordii]MDP0397604.1 (2Fe-2S)-binding protein [Tsukamurella strandjordii]